MGAAPAAMGMGLLIRSVFCIGAITALSPVNQGASIQTASLVTPSAQAAAVQIARLCEADVSLCKKAALAAGRSASEALIVNSRDGQRPRT
ncbi:MAG: hypothetical protein ACRCWF_08215, partial [Beijerinckiaceae bacterium]